MGLISRYVDWILEPYIQTSKPIKVTTIPVVHPVQPAMYRPISFDQYIGQSRNKSILKSYIEGTKAQSRIMPHILIHGKAGCGKTTLAKIIANELQTSFNECITSTIKTIPDLLTKIWEANGGIIFLDEIHGLPRDLAESLYTIMEDFTWEGVLIPEFTLIGATTELGELLKDRKPFVERFKIPLEIEDYLVSELATLARQYRNMMFPNIELDPDVFMKIGCNARRTPRTAIRLVEATIYLNKNINQVLKNFSIIKNGYTVKDLKTLEYIQRNDKGVGLQGLVAYLQTSTENYLQEVEPYLLCNDLIIRTPRGRKITDEGRAMISDLKNN